MEKLRLIAVRKSQSQTIQEQFIEPAMKKLIFLLLPILAVGCATPLTQKARQLTVIEDPGVIATLDCKELGTVTGTAGIWGSTAGFERAFNEAKNAAADIPTSNTILVTNSQVNPRPFVNADVYNCADQ